MRLQKKGNTEPAAVRKRKRAKEEEALREMNRAVSALENAKDLIAGTNMESESLNKAITQLHCSVYRLSELMETRAKYLS